MLKQRDKVRGHQETVFKGADRRRKEGTKKAFRTSPLQRGMLAVGALVVMTGILKFWPKVMDGINRPIARVEVHASLEQVQSADVEKVLSPWLKNRFFYLDLDSMRWSVLGIPWVKEVSIKRDWPDKLVVSLQEREAIARWKDGLIDMDGEVFRPEHTKAFGMLPVLSGPENQARVVMQQYLAISQLLRPLGLSVRELKLSHTDSWLFKVDHVAVNIGRDRRMERLQRFVRLFHAKLSDHWQEVKRVDLRYVNGASVAWK